MNAPENRVKGGLFALRVAEARLIEEWATSTQIQDEWHPEDELLVERLREWIARHEDAT